jgi:ribonuclease Z
LKTQKQKRFSPKQPHTQSQISMKCFVQVLGTETHDSNSSLLIFFDQKRYVINVNEGLFRFCTEHKVKVAKMQHLFLSRLHPDQCGGLPGFLLTLADANAK